MPLHAPCCCCCCVILWVSGSQASQLSNSCCMPQLPGAAKRCARSSAAVSAATVVTVALLLLLWWLRFGSTAERCLQSTSRSNESNAERVTAAHRTRNHGPAGCWSITHAKDGESISLPQACLLRTQQAHQACSQPSKACYKQLQCTHSVSAARAAAAGLQRKVSAMSRCSDCWSAAKASAHCIHSPAATAASSKVVYKVDASQHCAVGVPRHAAESEVIHGAVD